MKTLILDPFRVKPFADQPRKRFRGIDRLARSIKLVGQVTPVIVTACEENGFDAELVDGERRLQACRQAKVEIKAVMQEDGKSCDRFALSIAANFCRQGHDAMEIAEAIKRLRHSGRNAGEIAGIFGKSTCWVYQHAILLELAPEVQSALMRAAEDVTRKEARRGGRITLGLALLMKPLSHKQQVYVCKRITTNRLSFSHARDYIKALAAKGGHVEKQRAAAPRTKLDRFAKAAETFSGAVDRVAEMNHAALKEAIEAISAKEAAALAAKLTDAGDKLRLVAAALRKRSQ